MLRFRHLCLVLVSLSAASGQLREKRFAPVDPVQGAGFAQRRSAGVAVLVGIGKYPPFIGLQPLKYPGRDVDRLQQELEAQRYKVVPLKDERATREAVLGAIRMAAEALDKKSGMMIFFFSGHGFSVDGKNYLATYDSSADRLAQTGLPLSVVEETLQAAGAPRRVLWIDACRDEATKGVKIRSFDRFASAEGTRILFSTKAGSVSYEDDGLQQGIFSYFLLRGLQGAAARDDGLISFGDLAEYVIDAVQKHSLDQGKIQAPYEGGEYKGDFLLAVLHSPTNLTTLPSDVGTAAPGEVRENSRDGQRYAWIPAGSFQMGCSPGDVECYDDERPTHRVTLSKGFWMAQTPATVGAWVRYAQKTGHSIPAGTDSFGRRFNELAGNESVPIVSVSFADDQAFCNWAGMRLPTEAEWEYAARAQDISARYGELDRIAWYGDNSGNRRIDSARLFREDEANFNRRQFENGNGPKAAGMKQPNAWKLYDMLGNVWQWTADWYGEDYYSRGEPVDPTGPPGGNQRILRGGSWANFPRLVRVSYRERYEPGVLHNNVGFRCAGGALPAAP